MRAARARAAQSCPSPGARCPSPPREPRELRVAITRQGEDGLALTLAEPSGAPWAAVGELRLREISSEQLAAQGKRDRDCSRLEWSELGPTETAAPAAEDIDALREALQAERPGTLLWSPKPEQGQNESATKEALEAVQDWLESERSPQAQMIVLTEGAQAASPPREPRPDPAPRSGAWCARAQSSTPARFALIDTDGSEASQGALGGAGARRRGAPARPARGRALGARGSPGPLAKRRARERADRPREDRPHHRRHRRPRRPDRPPPRRAPRRPPPALGQQKRREGKGAAELKAELEELGAKATIAACDVSDARQLEELLGRVPQEHPLGAVFHSAGVLDDGIVVSQDAERLERVFAPKADAAAWHLHELTEEAELSHFVLFSSVAGTLGAPGQANYAAANAFLDALAQKRSAEGLAATSIAWGLWEQAGRR